MTKMSVMVFYKHLFHLYSFMCACTCLTLLLNNNFVFAILFMEFTLVLGFFADCAE